MAKEALPEKMRICLVSEKFPVIGRAAAQGFLWPIARGLAKAGHSVTLISWDSPFDDRTIEKDGVHAHFVKGPTPSVGGCFLFAPNKNLKNSTVKSLFTLFTVCLRRPIALANKRNVTKWPWPTMFKPLAWHNCFL